MQATISLPPLPQLRDAQPGDLFVAYHPLVDHCVLALALALALRRASNTPQLRAAVVVATTSAANAERIHLGRVVHLPETTTITFVEQVERVAFRARRAPDSYALSPLERELLEAQLHRLRHEIEPSPGAETPPATS